MIYILASWVFTIKYSLFSKSWFIPKYATGWMFIVSSNFRNAILSELSYHTVSVLIFINEIITSLLYALVSLFHTKGWNQSHHKSPEIHGVQVLELAPTPILFYKSAPFPIILKTSLHYTIVSQLIFDKLF